MTMWTRISPERIIQSQIWEGRARGDAARDAVRALESHGYKIVHRDDVCPGCGGDGVIWNGEGGSAFTSPCHDCRDL